MVALAMDAAAVGRVCASAQKGRTQQLQAASASAFDVVMRDLYIRPRLARQKVRVEVRVNPRSLT